MILRLDAVKGLLSSVKAGLKFLPHEHMRIYESASKYSILPYLPPFMLSRRQVPNVSTEFEFLDEWDKVVLLQLLSTDSQNRLGRTSFK